MKVPENPNEMPKSAAANSFQGQLYTVPFGYNSNVLYYNKNLFRAAGSPYTFVASTLPTHARYRIAGPAAVRDFLTRFVERRQAVSSARTLDRVIGD